MKIRISGETFDVPPPVPAAGEIVIAVERYIPVDLPHSEPVPFLRVSLLNLRKVLFFLFREGISLTLAKIRAISSHSKLGENRALVVALGTDTATGRPGHRARRPGLSLRRAALLPAVAGGGFGGGDR